ncbi:preprotein translocase subunit SecG [candidate division WWE3 bacterium RIFOXYC2_FULL_42_13]|uniref:Protein-export membrane protein SecG n=1 Tax=candidate division WWE3 bacterium TaxID=2053526 RepID=A0A3D0ZP15_UNCKA|nr:MAG: preprotein translocase subunit SecG [candidate division WWE3 bacterium RIFOXYA2_FULL_43_12]OGC66634.1 MAG: preprotein translocase subunit SecG [candidate division WWE3 bacterium RIFOXYA12_FULL_43_11]OGC73105.1 MAG: preprotein translocase subunit SecG [candidate division WWE3 bacterium RIFOXYC2_FULL_42_13]OGC73504.1 MAG: preprotein translocase subunit SecG [candidate division WWE3 bacterium RIFOXYB2_FULL_43_9]OGC74666.1 MAG: preprotein translocase subunit SecG [candidate division WWE3 ba
MIPLLKTTQVIISIALVLLILIQTKNAGLSSGLKNSFTAYRSLRGVEKAVFILTAVLGVFLVANSFLLIKLS